tara:strand:+ start:17 stop:826 length:810 start_codon:yes stop_codon:yes gene_type:complete
MDNATIYCMCLHDKVLPEIKKVGYVPVGLSNDNYSKEWLKDNTLENISYKNKYYGEYTFYYWFWKNILPKASDNHWIGFCSYRELWGNKKKMTENSKFEEVVLTEVPREWDGFDTVIGEHIYMNDLKLSKLIKHGLLSLARNPSALFKSKRNIRFHFDMWHGNGNLDKAIDLLNDDDKEDFRQYTIQNVSFSRGNMFVCRSKKIINDYFNSIFPWLKRCEKIFGFNLEGYGKTRMYTFLAERYLSYWFDKYTKPLLWPVIFYDITKKIK